MPIRDAGDQAMLEVDIKSMGFTSSEGAALDVLRDLRFTCESDSFTSIVGPSGCGKTTTLRCILGLETSYDGAINTTTGSAHKISAVFQEPRLLPWRTVDQNVRLALKSTDEKALDNLFAELGLTEHRAFYPAELSLGLARRAGLARAFAVEPSVLILDEPFVSLDDATASRLRKLLIRVWSARSCTALMVTHNLLEAIELSDRILFFSGSPSKVASEYRVPVAREYRDPQTITRIRDEIIAQGVPESVLTAESE